jgi:hypothetical protein
MMGISNELSADVALAIVIILSLPSPVFRTRPSGLFHHNKSGTMDHLDSRQFLELLDEGSALSQGHCLYGRNADR